jgi:hypothetical protein
MKTKVVTSILLVAILAGGCASLEAPPKATELLPGVYVSHDPADFPFPTAGYTVYIVGETHGNQETKSIFQTYLQSLYTEAGLRNVILEEDQAYETDANAYVHGLTDRLHSGLCLRTDILGQLREFNASRPEEEQVVVHLVDVDSPLPIIYKHLAELHNRIGPAAGGIPLPEPDDFEDRQPAAMYTLIDELRNAAKAQPDILNELDTVEESIRWYLHGNEVDTGPLKGSPERFFPPREEVITRNIQHVLDQLDGKPVLAFFGAAHGMKNTTVLDIPMEGFVSWGERLDQANVRVYSMRVDALAGGGYWRENAFTIDLRADDYQFEDGSSLVSLFETNPDAGILYADLRVEENLDIRLPADYPNIPISQSYDGLVLFKEFTPMENACLR